MPPFRRSRNIEFGVVWLILELLPLITNGVLPPLTVMLIIGQAFIYIDFYNVFPYLERICLSYENVFAYKQASRLFLSHFFHVDDMHLYYNMISFAWKGNQVERTYGSKKLLSMIFLFSLANSLIYLFISYICYFVLHFKSALTTCACGFSSIIFALKVVCNYDNERSDRGNGTVGSHFSSFAIWLELIFIQLFVPNVSFIGHISGIIAGLLFVQKHPVIFIPYKIINTALNFI